jgi:heptosyltransferase-1
MKIAIVKLSALGDIVHAMIVLQYIQKHDKNIKVDWFVEERFAQILQNNPHINKIHKLKLKNNLKGLWKEYKKLKNISKNSYDLVIDLQGLIKSAIVSKILGENVVGFDKRCLREPIASLFYKKTFYIPYENNVILRNLELTCKALEIDMPNIKNKKPFLYCEKTINIKPVLLIIVGSSWESKVYPKEYFVKVINSLDVETFISWGNETEKNNAKFICAKTKASLLPKLDLDELKGIISNSQLVIGADSGPTHMAWALNIPSITIFGPTPSQRNTYKTDINLSVDCEKNIDANNLDKNDMCIKNIKPEKIINLAEELVKC